MASLTDAQLDLELEEAGMEKLTDVQLTDVQLAYEIEEAGKALNELLAGNDKRAANYYNAHVVRRYHFPPTPFTPRFSSQQSAADPNPNTDTLVMTILDMRIDFLDKLVNQKKLKPGELKTPNEAKEFVQQATPFTMQNFDEMGLKSTKAMMEFFNAYNFTHRSTFSPDTTVKFTVDQVRQAGKTLLVKTRRARNKLALEKPRKLTEQQKRFKLEVWQRKNKAAKAVKKNKKKGRMVVRKMSAEEKAALENWQRKKKAAEKAAKAAAAKKAKPRFRLHDLRL